jgi:tripartite-type tricarboxylate transporter receptor subunit TctC
MLRSALIFIVLSLAASNAVAQQRSFPTRPITLIVPFAAGGPLDAVARVISEEMARELGQPVIIENAVGAGGTIGAMRVAHALPDGHTLLIYHIGMATAPTLHKKTFALDPLKEFEPIGIINELPMVMIGRSGLAASTFEQLQVTANTTALQIAHAGAGSASHLCALLFSRLVKAKQNMVPYRGNAPALNDLIAGHVDLLCDATTTVAPYVETAKVAAFYVTSVERNATVPSVTSVRELRQPQLEMTIRNALYAPKGTSPSVIARLEQTLQRALQSEAIVAKLRSFGTRPNDPSVATAANLREHLALEIARWTPILEADAVAGQ